MWKNHLERDDSRIVGEENVRLAVNLSVEALGWKSSDSSRRFPLPLVQTCSQGSCAALCTAPSAPTTPTPSTCSATCRCPSPSEASWARSRSGTVWTSSHRRRNWTRRTHRCVMMSPLPPAKHTSSSSWGVAFKIFIN